MYTRTRLAVFLLLVFVASSMVSASTLQLPDIDRASTERVIRVLADDDMEGRGAFTPAAMRAAEFIASEFEAIGLATIPGNDASAPGLRGRTRDRSVLRADDRRSLALRAQP